MKHQLKCSQCNSVGYGGRRTWWKEVLLLAIQPNLRGQKKIWLCRKCLRKNWKLDDDDFLKLIDKLRQRTT